MKQFFLRLKNFIINFTLIEILVFLLGVLVIGTIVINSIRDVRAENRDQLRKTEINTLAYQLESFHQTAGYYPEVLSPEILATINLDLLSDEKDKLINSAESIYSYTTRGCSETKCNSFTLKSMLEKEAPFTQESLAH